MMMGNEYYRKLINKLGRIAIGWRSDILRRRRSLDGCKIIVGSSLWERMVEAQLDPQRFMGFDLDVDLEDSDRFDLAPLPVTFQEAMGCW